MKKRTAVILISLLGTAIVVLGIFSMMMRNRNLYLERNVAADYQRAFGELVGGVSAVDCSLQKSLYATSPSMAQAVCAQVYARAVTANMALGALPFSAAETQEVSGFISKVGDYAFSLSRSAARGQRYTDEERSNLRALSGAATVLSQNLRQMQADAETGALSLGGLEDMKARLNAVSAAISPSTAGGVMALICQEFPELPALVYDGPFSEHLDNPGADLLKDLAPVDESGARTAAAKFLGLRETAMYPSGSCDGDLPCYYFSSETDGGELTVAVTERGGLPLSMFSSRAAGEASRSAEEGVTAAERFLSERGFSNMRESYHVLQGGVLTVNFAYEQDGVLCYRDLVKVCVALDTGKICGFEARGYLLNHRQRQLEAVQVDAETAKQSLPPELKLLSSSMALIPSPGEQQELLCHEFVCEAEDGRKCILYVNAVTGEEEQILLLLEDDSGALAV